MAPDNGGNKNEKQEKLFCIKKSLKVGKNFYSKFTLLLIPVCINKDLMNVSFDINYSRQTQRQDQYINLFY